MAEELLISTHQGKAETYQELLPQIKSLIEGEKNLVANLANIAGALKQTFNWWWVGFYLVDETELVLGPFQGPIACTRIGLNKGVCGTAWAKSQTIIVPNVEEFPGHIACSALSKSEIVVPIIKNGNVVAVLDADSELLGHYDAIDQHYLEKLAAFVAALF
jgi:L-methionine (R)-S-oxide reductase